MRSIRRLAKRKIIYHQYTLSFLYWGHKQPAVEIERAFDELDDFEAGEAA